MRQKVVGQAIWLAHREQKVDRQLLALTNRLHLLWFEGKINGSKTRGQTRRNWTDDIKEWTNHNVKKPKKSAENSNHWKKLAHLPST